MGLVYHSGPMRFVKSSGYSVFNRFLFWFVSRREKGKLDWRSRHTDLLFGFHNDERGKISLKVLSSDILQDMLMSYSLVDLTRRKNQYVIQAEIEKDEIEENAEMEKVKIEKSEIEKAVFVKTQCNVEAEVLGNIETTTAEKMKT